MLLAVLSLIIAAAAAGWLLFRLAGADAGAGGQRSMTLLKTVVLLTLVAALFAARLWPLAFMVLVGAGGVMAIEAWRAGDRSLDEADARPPASLPKRMTEEEALSVLGLEPGADAETIRAAHRKLISQLHPDKGGTDYFAAKINEARDFLLKRQERQAPKSEL